MNEDEATLAVIATLVELGIGYVVVGSLSSNAYGVPRSTQDADILIELGSNTISRLAARLGPAFHVDPQMSFETVTMTTRHVLTIPSLSFRIELFHLSDDPHDQERFRRRRAYTMFGRTVSMPTPEDVVITKLRWTLLGRRGKDRDDLLNVLAVQGQTLDWDYIYQWCDQHGTRALLDEIRQSVPKV